MSRSCHLAKVQSLESNQAVLISKAIMSPFTIFINLAHSLEECTYFEHLTKIKALIIKALKQTTTIKIISQITNI